MADQIDDKLLKALRTHKERNTVQVEMIASDARSGGSVLSATLRGQVQFAVKVQDSGVSRSSGSIS